MTVLLRRKRQRLPGGRLSSSSASGPSTRGYFLYIVVSVAMYAIANYSYRRSIMKREELSDESSSKIPTHHQRHEVHHPSCLFREYPPTRYYGLDQKVQPKFLRDADYIYGKKPILLQLQQNTGSTTNNEDRNDSSSSQYNGKFCVDQSEWQPSHDEPPFADGTNPSILLLDRMKNHPLYESFQHIGVKYVATLCFTNSQCAWKNDTPNDKLRYGISNRSEPLTVRTMLLLLDGHGRTLHSTTIYLQFDDDNNSSSWGRRKKHSTTTTDGTANEGRVLQIRALDDARLFINGPQHQLWVSFREGKIFGYDRQVIMQVHMEFVNGNTLKAIVKSSETATFCCGRNMALMQSTTGALQSLTWVDPVTVVDVDDKKQARRRLQQQQQKILLDTAIGQSTSSNDIISQHRQLMLEKSRKSHFHGTNAFMVPFGDNELLGIGHFHRPPGRDRNDYARFGHHYTHAFFTITATTPHVLKRLSREFVLPSKSNQMDADIIQFASGLEVDDNGDNHVILAYGINDCEGAMVHVDRTVVENMLQNVPEGKEVIDLMKKVD